MKHWPLFLKVLYRIGDVIASSILIFCNLTLLFWAPKILLIGLGAGLLTMLFFVIVLLYIQFYWDYDTYIIPPTGPLR